MRKTADELLASEITHLTHAVLIKYNVFTDVITSLDEKTIEVYNVGDNIRIIVENLIKTRYGHEWTVISRKGNIK